MQLTSDRIKITQEQKNTILSAVAHHLDCLLRETLDFYIDEDDCTFDDLRDELLADISDPDDRSDVFGDAVADAVDYINEDFRKVFPGLRNTYPTNK